MHHAEIAFGNQVGDGQPVAAVSHGDLRHKPQMAGHKLVRRVDIAALLPCLRQHVFLLLLKHRKGPDLLKVTREVPVGTEDRKSCFRSRHRQSPPSKLVWWPGARFIGLTSLAFANTAIKSCLRGVIKAEFGKSLLLSIK